MVSNNRQEGFLGVLQLLALSSSVFRFDGRGVLFAPMVWIATHPLTSFLSFLQPLSVPLCLLKRQDISVPAGALGMAEPGLRVSAALNKLSVVFSAAPAGHCYPTFKRFPHSDAVPHCVCAGWLWGRQGAQPRQWQLLSICRQQLCFSCAQRHCSF